MINLETLVNFVKRNKDCEEPASNQYGFTYDGTILTHCGERVIEPEYNYMLINCGPVFIHRQDFDTIFGAFKSIYRVVVIGGEDEDRVNVGYDYKSKEFVMNEKPSRYDILRPDGKPLCVPRVYFDETVEQLKEDLVEEMPEENGLSKVMMMRCKRCGHPYLVDWSYYLYIKGKGWKVPVNCTTCREQIRKQKESEGSKSA